MMGTMSGMVLIPEVTAAWIGFVATALAAVFAAFEFWFRNHAERGSVNTAVNAEVQRLLTVIRDHELWWAGCIANKDTDHPLIPFSHAVYAQQVKKVGLLDRQSVDTIVQFYGYVDFINELQASREKYKNLGKLNEFNLLYDGALLACLEDYDHLLGETKKRDKDARDKDHRLFGYRRLLHSLQTTANQNVDATNVSQKAKISEEVKRIKSDLTEFINGPPELNAEFGSKTHWDELQTAVTEGNSDSIREKAAALAAYLRKPVARRNPSSAVECRRR